MNTLDGGAAGGFRSAFLINLASAVGGNLLRFGVGLLLARLLLPEELGLVAIALALLGLAQVLRDFGVGAYLQRAPVLDAAHLGSSLGLLYASTALLAVLLWAAAGPLARHFGQPALQDLLQVLLLGFVLSPFSLVMSALMQRELAAARIATVSRLGGLAHAMTALGLAAWGCGAMSLAWAQVVNGIVCSGAYWSMRPPGLNWRPSRQGWRALLHHGWGTLLGSGLSSLNNALPDLLLGRMGLAQQVGLLGRAGALVNLFNALAGTAVNFGALRSLSDLHHRQAALAPWLLRSTALLTGAVWPVLAVIAWFGEPLVLWLFGRTWIDSAVAIPPLAGAAALGLLFSFGSTALSAIGQPLWAALPVAVTLLARLALVALCYDGRLAGFAWLLLGAAVLALPVQGLLLVRVLGVPARALLQIVAQSLLPCLAVLGVLAVVAPLGSPLPAALATVPFVWLLALRLLRHALWDEIAQCSLRLRSTIRK